MIHCKIGIKNFAKILNFQGIRSCYSYVARLIVVLISPVGVRFQGGLPFLIPRLTSSFEGLHLGAALTYIKFCNIVLENLFDILFY